ncbi:HAD family hydrolase [Gottschalkiaceae bacterium SANA]|nr:HAD family hydrolase [Gottschalkiaceae bacterium SANA]
MEKAVIFDMDGVIIDSEQAHKEAAYVLIDRLGFSVSEALFETFTGRRSVDCWKMMMDVQEKDFDLDPILLAEEEEKIFFSLYYGEKQAVLVSGVQELMMKFRAMGIPMIVASSSPVIAIEKMLTYFKLESVFSGFVSGSHVKHGKPAPDIFLAAAEKLNFKPGDCLVIEDSDAGVEAANRAGMKVIGFANPNSHNQKLNKANLVVEDFMKEWDQIQKLLR